MRQPAKRAEIVKDRNENDAWVWDVFQQQDARRKTRGDKLPTIGGHAPESEQPVRLPGGCLLYQLSPWTHACES